jgi:hypothetical protein
LITDSTRIILNADENGPLFSFSKPISTSQARALAHYPGLFVFTSVREPYRCLREYGAAVKIEAAKTRLLEMVQKPSLGYVFSSSEHYQPAHVVAIPVNPSS